MTAPVVRATATPHKFTATDTVTITKPSGTVDGDLLVFVLESAEAATDVSTWPYGSWVPGHRTTGSGQCGLIGYKLVASSEPSSWTFTLNGARNGIATVVVIDGSTTANTLSGTEAGQQTVSGTSHATPNITTDVADCLLLTNYGSDRGGSRTWTQGSDTELMDDEETSLWVSLAIFSAVAATADTYSKTGTSSANCIGDTGIMAIRPVSGTQVSDNQTAYLKGRDTASDNQPAYTKGRDVSRSEEHTSELQSQSNL